jgi:TRAP-type C4-dicarboxylate transport system permease small subunit
MLSIMGNILSKIERYLAVLATLFLIALMLLGTANVTGRFVFDSPITGATEFMRVLMAGSFLLALAITQAKGQHTAMTDIVKRYPPKVRYTIEFIVLLVSLVLFGIMTWRSAMLVGVMWERGDLIQTVRIPEAPFRLLLPVGAFVLCLEFIRQMIHVVAKIKSNGE